MIFQKWEEAKKYAESSWVKQENCDKLWTSGTNHQFSLNKTICFRSRWCWRNLDRPSPWCLAAIQNLNDAWEAGRIPEVNMPILSGKSDSSGEHWSDDSDVPTTGMRQSWKRREVLIFKSFVFRLAATPSIIGAFPILPPYNPCVVICCGIASPPLSMDWFKGKS